MDTFVSSFLYRGMKEKLTVAECLYRSYVPPRTVVCIPTYLLKICSYYGSELAGGGIYGNRKNGYKTGTEK